MNNSSQHIQLITRILSGNANAADKANLDEWLAMSTENQNEFQSYQNIWEIVGRVESKAHFDTNESWSKLNTMISCIESSQDDDSISSMGSKRTSVTIGFYLKRIAAVFVLAFGLYFLIHQFNQPQMLSVDSIGLAQFTTDLPDGTQVSLNKTSKITYPEKFDGSERRISFNGEALFQVAHNPEMPMIIETDNLRVKVLGTTFDLINYPESNEILLYLQEGKVLFYSVDPTNGSVVEQIVLTPGQIGVYNKATNEISKDLFESNNFLAWQTGVLEFDKTPLADVFSILEKTYGIEIADTQSYENLLLTARYQDESITSIFESLHIIFGIDYTIEDKHIILQ